MSTGICLVVWPSCFSGFWVGVSVLPGVWVEVSGVASDLSAGSAWLVAGWVPAEAEDAGAGSFPPQAVSRLRVRATVKIIHCFFICFLLF